MTSLRRTQLTREERLERLEPYKDRETGLYRDANRPEKLSTLKETDLGHKTAYEERALRDQAQKMSLSQKQFDDMIKHSEKYTGNGESIFQAEYYKYNRSHIYECWDKLIARHNAREMTKNYKQAEKEGRTDLMMKKEKFEKKQDEKERQEQEKKRRIPPEKDKAKQKDSNLKSSIGKNKSSGKSKSNGKEQSQGKTKTASISSKSSNKGNIGSKGNSIGGKGGSIGGKGGGTGGKGGGKGGKGGGKGGKGGGKGGKGGGK